MIRRILQTHIMVFLSAFVKGGVSMSRSCRLRELKITKGFLMLCVQMACCAVLVSACAPFSYVGEEAEEVKETAANDETAYEGTTIEDDRKTEIDLSERVDYTDDLSDEARAICGDYFKAGDALYKITIEPGDMRN